MAKVVTQAAFTISGTLAQGLARIAIPILVGRFTDQSTLAHVSLVLSVAVLLSMVWPTPAGTAASRYASENVPGALSTLRLTTAASLAVVAIAAGLIIGVQADSLATGLLGALVTATYSAYFFTRGVFIGRFRARRLTGWEITGAVIAVGGTVLSLAAGSWMGALVALAIGYALIAAVGWPWRAGEAHPFNREVFSFTAHNAVANASSNGMVQLAMVIVFAGTGSVEAGLFAAAFSLATPASLFGQTINQVLIPHLAEQARASRPQARPLIVGAAQLIAVTIVPFAAVFVLSPVILPLLYGQRFAGAVPLLQALVVAMFFFTVALYPAAALTAWGNARELVAANGIALVVGVTAMIVLTVTSGALGTALGLVAGTVILSILSVAFTARALGKRV